jgi:hypothetical protein
MLRLLFCLLLLLLVAFAGFAQEGLKISAQVTPCLSLSFNPQDRYQSTTLKAQPAFGYSAGLLLGYGITEAFSISTGVSYYEYQARFEHQRRFLSDGSRDLNAGKTALRQSNYLRLPLLLGLASDPNRKWGVMARFGPHFNFLLQARYFDQRLEGYSGYNSEEGINLKQEITLYQENTLNGGLIKEGGEAAIYNTFVPGITAEVGLQWRVTDQIKLTALVHLEGSSNPEDEGAASLAHNLARGDYLVTANPFDAPELSRQDLAKQQQEGTPFETVFPNYTDEAYPNASIRAPTWQFMLGLQLGIVYTYKAP